MEQTTQEGRAPYHPTASKTIIELTDIASGTPDRAQAGAVTSDIMVAMRDGIRLATDVYLPDAAGPFPAMLIRLPYGKTEAHCAMPATAAHWNRKGYACIVQDVRGKWGSEGAFHPADGVTETCDGYDTLEWLAGQPWSNGRVGMWGESYYGFTSLAGATSQHRALRAIAPGNIGCDRYRNVFRGGAFQYNTMGNWALSMVVQSYQDVTAADPWHLPVREIARAAGLESPYFEELIDNLHRGPFWEARSLLAAWDKVRIPVLEWCGWYGCFLGGQIRDFQVLAERNAPDSHIHLFVGPWDHEGSSEGTSRIGATEVGIHAEHRWDTFQAFFDCYVMGIDNGFGREPRVHYFAMGASQWRKAQAWPPAQTRFEPWYLSSGGRANTLYGDGTLGTAAPAAGMPPDTYAYDPQDPVADTLAMNCWGIAGELGDRREIEVREDVLVYTGPVQEADLDLTGPITARLWAATSAPETDFWLGLVDVNEKGYGTLIQDGILRTSYRDGEGRAPHLKPGEAICYDIDLWATSYTVRKGHRLRLEVTSSCFNKYDRNTNTGLPIGRAAHTVVAQQTILHDALHPSHVLLPVQPA
ncbi:MAG: CocE/NonD family hydrolase [Proteobacteria bacterium]|nr:CocE/NonD family hydrolase [Pseudomonadota bacterium]MDA0951658.1 CocE/NonD family hydrolase [Pseudomonadota bacterium]